jgi:pyruvate kinase
VKVRPQRGADGRVQRLATVRFVGGPTGGSTHDATVTVVPVEGDVLTRAQVGDEIILRDTRDRRRRLVVTSVDDVSIDAVVDRTTYVATGMSLSLRRGGSEIAAGAVGPLPRVDSFIRVSRDELVRVRRGDAGGRAAVRSTDGTVLEPATISCQLDAVFDEIAVGHRVLIDDGSIHAVVTATSDDWFDIVVTHPANAKLKGGKGINLPDTDIAVPALSADDLAALDAVTPLADLVSLSFVRQVGDVHELRIALAERGRPDVAMGLKIEHDGASRPCPTCCSTGSRARRWPSCSPAVTSPSRSASNDSPRSRNRCSGCAKQRTCPSSGPRRWWNRRPSTVSRPGPR